MLIDYINKSNDSNSIEFEFEDRLLTPLIEHEKDETYTEEKTQVYEPEIIDTQQAEKQRKRAGRLNELGAKGIVKVVDIGFANFASYLSYSNDVIKYRADPEAIEDLTEVVSEAIPTPGNGGELKIPLWAQILIYSLIAFLPILFVAISDRRKNKEIQLYKREIRKLRQERKVVEMQKEKLDLETDLQKEYNKQSETETVE